MSLFNPVVWHDGMFMKAQHFQQQERYLRTHANMLSNLVNPHAWGVTEIEVNDALLSASKIGIKKVKGITQDQTPFVLPEQAAAPEVIEIDPSVTNTVVYLCCPLPSEREQLFDEEADSATYHLTEQQVVDASYKSIETANITVGQLNFILKLESEDRSSFTSIPLFRISQVRSDGRIEFDENFIPTCLDIDASPYVSKFLEEFTALLKHRAESIVEQLGMVDQQGVSSVSDIMLLQSINRIEPLFEHFSKVEGLHPKALFEALVQVEGELATLCSKERRPMSFVPYSHGNLSHCLGVVMESARARLSVMSERRTTPLVLKEQGYGIHVAHIANRKLLDSSMFILAVKADVTLDTLYNKFTAQTKIGSLERIRDLINLQLPGISIKPMPVVPRQLPYHAGYTYFELEKHGEEWQSLTNSSGIALHVSGDFPNISIQLWAVAQ